MADELAQDVARGWREAMLAGDWEAAWRQTDRVEGPRRAAQRAPGFVRDPAQLVWDGSSFAGRSVLVRCEHGLGDTLQFSRFLPALSRQARELQVMAQPHLVELLRGLPGAGEVKDGWCGPEAWPSCEVEVEVMELAYALRCAAPPPPYPHLAGQLPQPHRVSIADDGRLRVALLWAASEWDTSRSLTLGALEQLLRVPDVAFYSLQQGPLADDPQLERLGICPLSPRTAAIADAAGAMMQVHLVISVDGMPAHLAATLGRPTWLMLKHDADWRWLEGRTDTPWYPTMRLFRQAQPGDWRGVTRDVAAALRSRQL